MPNQKERHFYQHQQVAQFGGAGTERMYSVCREHLNQYVRVRMNDGRTYDGIVEYVDQENVSLLVMMDEGKNLHRNSEERQFAGYGYGYGYGPYDGGYAGYGGYPWSGYPGYGFYGYPYAYPRRFSRLILPLAALAAISLLPYY